MVSLERGSSTPYHIPGPGENPHVWDPENSVSGRNRGVFPRHSGFGTNAVSKESKSPPLSTLSRAGCQAQICPMEGRDDLRPWSPLTGVERWRGAHLRAGRAPWPSPCTFLPGLSQGEGVLGP